LAIAACMYVLLYL